MVQVKVLSDKWLSRDGLPGDFDTENQHFEDVLDFDNYM